MSKSLNEHRKSRENWTQQRLAYLGFLHQEEIIVAKQEYMDFVATENEIIKDIQQEPCASPELVVCPSCDTHWTPLSDEFDLANEMILVQLKDFCPACVSKSICEALECSIRSTCDRKACRHEVKS